MSGGEIWKGIMQCFLSSCKARDETEAAMSPTERSLCSDVRMVYRRGDEHTEK